MGHFNINKNTSRLQHKIDQLICYVYKKIVAKKPLIAERKRERARLEFILLNRKRLKFWQRKLWLIIHLPNMNTWIDEYNQMQLIPQY